MTPLWEFYLPLLCHHKNKKEEELWEKEKPTISFKLFFVTKRHHLDTFMLDNKQNILKFLIEHRLFAPSVSAFATRLGYTNRTIIYRLINNKIRKDETIDKIWNDTHHTLGVSEEQLIEIAIITERAKWFSNLIDKYPFGKQTPLWPEQILAAFVDKNYTVFPTPFIDEVIPLLEDLRKDDEEIFFGMLMLFYVKAKKFNPYTSSFKQLLSKLIRHLNEYFHSLHPENNVAYTAIQALTENTLLDNTLPCLWKLIENPILILQYYANPLFLNSALYLGSLFPEWGEISYWHTSETDFCEGQKVWMFMSRESDSIYHGSYIVQEFDIGKDNETFIPHKLFTILFGNKEDDEPNSIIQISNLVSKENNSYKFSYGLYRYIESSQEIQISFDSKNDNIYQLPHQMTRIKIGYPQKEKREKIWSYFIEKFDSKDARAIFSHNLCNLLNVEYLDDEYVIHDVSITRRYYSLFIEKDGQQIVYRISLETYSFLKNLSVFEEVVVCKHAQKLCIEWPWLGYIIPVSEFEAIKSHENISAS